ncbi:MAG: tetratricopeptide repeat protein [Candidatus Methanoperedens sp.]|nr:tetratricopeptide repeat protein [Candidatus Methanoperedens sp.]MCZ7394859.1 tetratricopeptide repeat protein [Candidatus Methanoperedens sp.]
MIKVFISSTFRDMEKERKLLRDKLKPALLTVGMEDFFPDGKTSQEIAIKKLKDSDIVIFLISPYYGSFLKECKVKDCKEECTLGEISYTHCEYKVALADNKPHLAYIIDKGWDTIRILKEWKEIDWRQVKDSSILNELNSDEIEHYFEVAKKVWRFKEEAEMEFCPSIDIDDIKTITGHLATNIGKWYSEGKINLKDFCGRKEELKDLLEKMDESVEVYGVGGIGKTTLIHVALIIQRLNGMKIVTVGTKQSYITDSGYKFFRENFKKNQYETIGNKIALDDIMYALSVPDGIRTKQKDEKIRIIAGKIENENIFLFIDDFQLADDDVKELVKNTHRNMVLASKKKMGLTKNELHLTGIDAEDRGELIDLIAYRLDEEISDEVKEKIKDISEGHPVFTEILVRNNEMINFQKLKEYKQAFDLSNPDHVAEFLSRVIEEVLSKDAFILLKNLSVINTDLETNLDVEAIKRIYPTDFNKIFRELIDTGFLEKRRGDDGIYRFSYKHIQEAMKGDEKEMHGKAIEYYKNKSEKFQDYDDVVEILYHSSKLSQDAKLINIFLGLSENLRPVHYGFKRLIDVGEELKNYFGDDEKASILGTLGILYSNLNKFEDAERSYKEALKFYKKLAKKSPDAYLPYVARAQNNLGILYSDLERFEDAKKALIEALKISKELAKKNPDAYLPEVASVQNNLGTLYGDLKKFEDAEKAFTETLKFYKKLAKKSPDAYLRYVAGAQNNLGILYSHLKKFEDAEKAYTEALKISKELAKKSPDAYLPEVATNQNNLGILYRHLKKFEDARRVFTEALKIRKELAKKSPDAYLPDVAATQNNLGTLYRHLNKFEDARKAYTEALKIRKELAKKSPDAYLPAVAKVQNNLGILYSDLERFEDAKKALIEALKISKEVAKKNPDAYLPEVARVQNNLGILYGHLNKFEDAEKAYTEALKIRKELAKKVSTNDIAH